MRQQRTTLRWVHDLYEHPYFHVLVVYVFDILRSLLPPAILVPWCTESIIQYCNYFVSGHAGLRGSGGLPVLVYRRRELRVHDHAGRVVDAVRVRMCTGVDAIVVDVLLQLRFGTGGLGVGCTVALKLLALP